MLSHVRSLPPRRLIPPLLLLVIASLLLGLYNFGSNSWLQGIKYHDIIQFDQRPAPDSFVPRATMPAKAKGSAPLQGLDTEALRRNFPKLKEATKRHSGPHKARLDQMMISYLPFISTSAWMLHSPNGKKFTVSEVQAVSNSTIQPGFQVPNIAHFVMPFGETNLQFHQMVSLLSCLHIMKPHRLLLWYAPGKLPSGHWWDRVRKNLTESEWEEKIIFVQRPIPTSVYSVPVHGKEHQSDVMRLEAVLVFGGLYMDIDVLVLKPLEPLRKFVCTIGREVPYGLCNGVFLSAPSGTFLAMWHTAYQVFNDEAWGEHSVKLPHSMQAAFPDLCHVEEESMDRPNWTPKERTWIYNIGQQSRWDWRTKNYVMHLWFRLYNKQHSMDSIRTLDSMYGEMCRRILYGSG
ncbi:hypothetical protein BOX15_Mlig029296g1 [Macrostomum lignano]|uniref:Alpha-1,4-N-acetylglucosaminyltransferase n=1 Tax=Macrostomum lignano TaxID=282301 RepID=A0A267FMX4_9PLAT|nr:hypothetical protein BOX15_Mlig029296g1 [Macrostomum lignano]